MTYRISRYYCLGMSTRVALTIKRRLADALLEQEGGVAEFVRERLEAGKSWRQVSIELRDRIDLDVHEHTLQRWLREDQAA